MKYELWETRNNETDVCSFFAVDENCESLIEQLEPNAKLIWTVEAESYDEAMTSYHKKMGWEDYKPLD